MIGKKRAEHGHKWVKVSQSAKDTTAAVVSFFLESALCEYNSAYQRNTRNGQREKPVLLILCVQSYCWHHVLVLANFIVDCY